MTFVEAVDLFLVHCEIEAAKSVKTLDNYSRYLRKAGEFFGFESDIGVLSLDDVLRYRVMLHRSGLSTKTQGYYIIALRAMLKFLAKRDVAVLSAEKIELPKIPERHIYALDREELTRLFDTVDVSDVSGVRDRAILQMLYSTWLRISELVSLDRQMIDNTKSQLVIRGKGQKIRTVFLSPAAQSSLRAYFDLRTDKHPAAFVSHRKKGGGGETRLSTVSIQSMVRNLGIVAGISKPVTPHVLRHSFATELLLEGADMRSVQHLLGHSSITTTQVYTHLTEKQLEEVFKKFHK